MGWGGQRHTLALLPPEQKHGTHCRGGRVSPKASLDGYGEGKVYNPHPVSNPNHQVPTTELHQHSVR
jgi:hypothetical protein